MTMRLSEKEAVVLASCDLRADAPLSLLKKETGLREHSIRYALRSLMQKDVIKPVALINTYKLGYANYNFYFSLCSQKKAIKASLLKALLKMPAVSWFAEFAGDYQYGMTITASTPVRAVQIIQELSRQYQGIIFEKSFSLQFSVTLYSRRYLSHKKFSTVAVTLDSSNDVVAVDDLDKKILEGLSTFGGLSHRQLAIKLNMPLSTLELRVKKLTDAGVLAGYVYAVNPTHYGQRIFNILIFAKGISAPLHNALKHFCNEHDHVIYLIECLGSWDYVVGVEVEHAEEVTSIVQDLYDQFSNYINQIKLLSKFKDVKTGWFKSSLDEVI